MRFLTNNPKKVVGLEGYGLKIVEVVPIKAPSNPHNAKYLETKRVKMGHLLYARPLRTHGRILVAPSHVRALTSPSRMSNILPSRPRQMGQRRTFAIVASQYNGEFVKGLVDHALRELEAIARNCNVHPLRSARRFRDSARRAGSRGTRRNRRDHRAGRDHRGRDAHATSSRER